MASSIRALPVLLFASLLASVPAAAQSLRFVTEDSYPFQYLENKQLKGMSVEIVSEMGKRAGVKVEHELLSWKDAYDRAQRDRATCIYSTARLENRERIFRWVGPIVENRWAAFGKKGLSPKPAGLDDLRRLRVGVAQGDAKIEFLAQSGIGSAVVTVTDDAINAQKLTTNHNESGKIDVWVTGYYSALNVAAQTGVKDVEHLFTFNSSPNFLACNYGMDQGVLKKLSAALDAMKKDGSHGKIVARYHPAAKK